jgi:cytochrome c553
MLRSSVQERLFTLILCLSFLLLIQSDGYSRGSDEAARKQFVSEVQPLLAKFCVGCHGPETSEADLRLDTIDPDLVNSDSGEHWEEVLNQLNTGKMPPEEENQLTDKQRNQIVDWATAEMRYAAEVRRSTGGRNLLRRLTRYEYNNTLRDLLGVDIDFAKDLPPEGTAAEGFKNNASVLITSTLHLEYYQQIAKNALELAFAFGEQPEPFTFHVIATGKDAVSKNKIGKKKKNKKNQGTKDKGLAVSDSKDANVAIINTASKLSKSFQGIPQTGPILIRIKAGSIPSPSGEYPQMHVNLGYDGGQKARPFKTIESIKVVAPSDALKVYEIICRADDIPLTPPATSKQQFIELFNQFDPGTSDIKIEDHPQLIVSEVEIIAPYYPEWPPKTRTDILGKSVPEKISDEYVRAVLEQFMTRAYRRPALETEVARMLNLYTVMRSRDSSFEEAITGTLSAVLSSPSFLLITEPSPTEKYEEKTRDLTDYELASRLSYFLWSTMPDQELMELASQNKLSEAKNLQAQVQRMLADSRSHQFVKHFTSQWLDLDAVYRVAVNPEFFQFDDALKETMQEETIQFVKTLLQEDISCMAMIDSDFTMLNAPLAKYYGIQGVSGEQFKKVGLQPEDHRGGVLTHGSVLLGNSTGDDTHPVKRGIWVLERLLNDPPPPPPPAVPTLAEEDKNAARQSLKQKLIAHRTEAACKNCHSKIDPWGVAFENYDGIGLWRDTNLTQKQEQPTTEKKVTAPVASAENPVNPKDKKYQGWTKTPLDAPKIAIAENDSQNVKAIKGKINAAYKSMQRPFNHLRNLGPQANPNSLSRFLGYLNQREPALVEAVGELAKELGKSDAEMMELILATNKEIIDSNNLVRKLASGLAPPAKSKKQIAEDKKKKLLKEVDPTEVDPRTTLPDNTEIHDLADLKAYLLKHKQDQFAEAIVRKTLSYSLGRYLEFSDKETVLTLTKQFQENGYKLNCLIEGIVLSEVFLTK